VNSSRLDQRTLGEMIRRRMKMEDSHHKGEEEESRPQVQQGKGHKGHTILGEVRARVKVQLVVLRRRMVMARAGRILRRRMVMARAGRIG
jgi:hypothetical protein